MPQVIPLMIGTAGHVDHGKTTLLARLVGEAPDVDRRPEEQARGLTIDIGYAELDLGDGREVGVMDVPGHERFVRNMVAAASGIDLVILVVAADDGVMPQTREHLEIADLLGATSGLAVITKIDLVDEELALAAEEELKELIAGTFLDGAPVLRVSAETGEGIEELKAALIRELDSARPRRVEGVFRVPVQRSFVFQGHGTLITGVPLAGTVRMGDTLEVVPGHKKCRVRGIQAYHHDVEEGRAGHRTALKLSDLSKRDVSRGSVLAEPGYLVESNLVEARLLHLPRRGRPLTSNLPVRFHTGTSEVLGRLFLLDKRQLAPGEDGLVQLRLDRPVVVAPGDRYVLRSPSPQVTLGGGRVIGRSQRKISAGRKRLVNRVAEREETLDDPVRAVVFCARSAGLSPVSPRDLARETLLKPAELDGILRRLLDEGELVAVGEKLLSGASIVEGRERLSALLDRFHRREPLRQGADRAWVRDQIGVSDPVLDRLIAGDSGVEAIAGARLRKVGHQPALSAEQQDRLDTMRKEIEGARFATPKESELPDLVGAAPEESAKLLALLVDEGAVVRVGDGVVFASGILNEAKEKLREWIETEGALVPADMKSLFGMSRKYSIPLLEWLDSTRFTVRKGDRRELA